MIIVDIITVPYAKEFISRIEFTRWDQISNINVWNWIVTVAEKRRMLIKPFSLITLIQINQIIMEDKVVIAITYYNNL